jgi:hypothetical protein
LLHYFFQVLVIFKTLGTCFIASKFSTSPSDLWSLFHKFFQVPQIQVECFSTPPLLSNGRKGRALTIKVEVQTCINDAQTIPLENFPKLTSWSRVSQPLTQWKRKGGENGVREVEAQTCTNNTAEKLLKINRVGQCPPLLFPLSKKGKVRRPQRYKMDHDHPQTMHKWYLFKNSQNWQVKGWPSPQAP